VVRAWTGEETGYQSNIGGPATMWDFNNYVQRLWHPGKPRGMSCADLERFGHAGDGGKMVCDASSVLNARKDCLVVSVGSNGDVSFEAAMRSFNSNCEFHIYDPYLTPEQAAVIPAWAAFFNEPFNATTALKPAYKGRSISILKIE
jgi:hypothetical protein